MELDFDPEANALYIRRLDGKIVDSEEVAPGIVYDYDAADRVVGIEILRVKQRTPMEIKSLNFPFEEKERIEFRNWFSSHPVVA